MNTKIIFPKFFGQENPILNPILSGVVKNVKNATGIITNLGWASDATYVKLETGKIYGLDGTNNTEQFAGPGTINFNDNNNLGTNPYYGKYTGNWNSTLLSNITGIKKIVRVEDRLPIALLKNGKLTGWGNDERGFAEQDLGNITGIKDIACDLVSPLFMLMNDGRVTGLANFLPTQTAYTGLFKNGPVLNNIKSMHKGWLYGFYMLTNNNDLISIRGIQTGIIANNVKKVVDSASGPVILFNNGTISGFSTQILKENNNKNINDFWVPLVPSNWDITLRLNDNTITGYGYYWDNTTYNMEDFKVNNLLDFDYMGSFPIGIVQDTSPSSSTSSLSTSSSSSSSNFLFPYLKIKDGIDPETELGISKQIAIIETYRNKSLILDLNKIILDFYLKNSSDYFCKNYPLLEILSVSNLPNNVFYRKENFSKIWIEGYPTIAGNYSVYILIKDLMCNKTSERYITLKVKDPKDSNQTYLTKKSNAKYIGFTKVGDRSLIKNEIPGKNHKFWFRSTKNSNITFSVSLYSGSEVKIKKWDGQILTFIKGNNILYSPINVTIPLKNSDPINKDIVIYNANNIKSLDLKNNSIIDFDYFGRVNSISEFYI